MTQDYDSEPPIAEYRELPAQPPRPIVQLPPERPTPILSYSLIGITVLVYVLQYVSQSLYGGDLPAALGMKVNDAIKLGEYWRLITPVFLHGSLMHIGFNMYALSIMGPGLELRFGRSRFLLLYFLCGFAGNIMSMIMSPFPSLGASTAIFGMIGAQGVFVFQNRDWFPDRGRSALRSIITISAINLVLGLSPGIDNWGHIGGLVGGVIFTFLAGPLLRPQTGPLGTPIGVSDERPPVNVFLAAVVVGGGFGLLGLAAILAGRV